MVSIGNIDYRDSETTKETAILERGIDGFDMLAVMRFG